MNYRKRMVSLLLALVLALSLAACGSSNENTGSNTNTDQGTQTAQHADNIVCALIAEPDQLDPQGTTNHRSRQVDVNIYESLLKENDDGTLSGCLAENWSVSEDELTYTFNLRQGVLFHNGETLKASDVVFTFNRGMESPYVMQFFPNVASVTATGEYTVEVVLSSPVSFFEKLMALPQTAIVNEKAVNDGGEDFGRNPVGTGPYQFVSWTSGSSIKLTAFEDYWGGKASITDCEYRIVTDTTTGTISLEKGEIDFFYELASTSKQTCEDNPNLTYEEGASTSYEHILINNEDEKLSDLNLRKALAYATDKASIITVATSDSGIMADSQVAPTMDLYCPDVKGYEYDVEKAKECLAQSAYPDGLTLTIQVNSGYREKIAQVLKANYAEIGVELEIQTLEFNTVVANITAGEFELAMLGRNLHMTNPVLAIDNNFNSKYSGGGGNYQRYKNPEVDQILDQMYAESDTAKQQEMMEQVLTALHDDVANIPLYWSPWSIAYNNSLKNVTYKANSYYCMYDFAW